jgi:hypothetical protein
MNLIRYGLLFLPYIIAVLLSGSPASSYAVAWGGSFWIFYLTLRGHVKPLPGGSSLQQQLFRPIGFTQLFFAGYTAVTSIFYFASLQGCYYLDCSAISMATLQERELAAAAQRYYVLGHASLSMGVLVAMDYRRSGEWTIRWKGEPVWLLLYIAGGVLLTSQVLKFVPGLGQFQVYLSSLAMVAGVLSFAVSLIRKRPWLIGVTGAIFIVNLYEAFLSGWKGAVLVLFVLLGSFLYPVYKRTVATVFPIVLAFLLFILPTYGNIFRSANWYGGVSDEKAARLAFDKMSAMETESLSKNTWHILTKRLSLASMFAKYIDKVPSRRSYYGLEIVENGLMSIIPSAIWAGKPDLEQLAMSRAYENGVIDRNSRASAKPPFIVDAYLSGGAIAVAVALFLFGVLASWASRLAERWFGGYLLGGLAYLGLFSIFWRGNAFEFFFNNVFWGFVILGALFIGGRMIGVIVPQRQQERMTA